jgi:dihydrofolate reductase
VGQLIVHASMSVNGAFEAPTPEEWLVIDRDSGQASLDQLILADAMVLGRKTYEGLAAVWPTLADDPDLGYFAERINGMPKYVASRTLREPLTWNSTLLEGNLEDRVRA